ncbi:Kelch-like protein 18 [Schistosoma japonicum]|nr:Kelch-like protein 18 [Schistosoma japonicum]
MKLGPYLPNTLNFQDREIYKTGFLALDCMRRDGKLCDITLIADANRFTAHKVVLAATIPFFNGMFLSNMAESTKSEVAIHGLDACALEAFIGYAYTGLVQINPRNVQSILIGANFLQLNNVRNICCRYISERLTVDIVLPLRSLAQSFLCTDLVSACEIYIFRNFEKIAHTSSFFNLEISELLELLESDELNVSSEEQLFHIVMSWVEYDTKLSSHTGANSDSSGSLTGPSENCVFNENSIKSDNYNGTDYPTPCRNSSLHSVHYSHSPYSVKSSDNKPRTDFLPCLLRRIRLPLIPVSFIFSVISRHELIRQDIRCRDILDEVRDTLLMSWKTTEFFNCRPRRCQDVFGVIYAVGGWNADLECHGIVETYHPSLGRWELSESMISRRSRIGVVALNGEFRCPNFYVELWKLISSLNEPRSAGGLVALGGRLYAIGGHNGLAVFSTVECYEKSGDIPRALSPSSYCETNPRVRQNSTNVWYSVANMLHRRCRHGATAFRDRIIVAGGYNGASFLQSVEMFDPTTGPDRNGLYGQWTEILSLSVPRSRVGLAVTAGCLYAIGGYDGTAHLRTVECFKPINKRNVNEFPSECLPLGYDTLSNLLNKLTTSDSYDNCDGLSCDNHLSSVNSDLESISSFTSTEEVGNTRNRLNIASEKPKPKPKNDNIKSFAPPASTIVNCNSGTSSSISITSSNPFSDWQWSLAPPLIAHEGWVGVCVLPFDQSLS